MPKYLIQGRFNSEGIKGVLAEGGSARRAAVEKMVSNLGGRLESYNFSFGAQDAVLIVELPDNATAAAISMTAAASGVVATSTTPLLTPEEVDAAARKNVEYTPPGR